MDKVKYVLLSFFIFSIGILGLKAKDNKLYNIDIKAHINNDGSMDVKETWYIKLDTWQEVYKVLRPSKSSEIINYNVQDETGKYYSYLPNWDDNPINKKLYAFGVSKKNRKELKLIWMSGIYGNQIFTIQYEVRDLVKK